MTAQQVQKPAPGTMMPFRLVLLAVAIVCTCFLIFIERPQFLGDTGYHAFSALQYVKHEVSAFFSIRFVNPRDLSTDVTCNLIGWPPAWTLLFVLAFKAGLSVGPAAKAIELLISICGAVGWVWITSILGLKRYWAVAGVILASLYCLRVHSFTDSVYGDSIVYAVTPWLIGSAILLCQRESCLDWRHIGKRAALCLALGSVYWLKYSGVFFGIAVCCALLVEHLRRTLRLRPLLALGVLGLYGASFVLPVLAEKAYNFARTGSDLIERARSTRPVAVNRTGWVRGVIEEALYETGITLFGAEEGVTRVTRDNPPKVRGFRLDYRPVHWLLIVPGLLLLGLFFYLLASYPQIFIRILAVSLIAVPVVGLPAITVVSGTRFVSALPRSCQPFWIFIELVILAIVSQRIGAETPSTRIARRGLAALTGLQLLFFCYLPLMTVRESWSVARSPKYETSEASIYVVDFSRTSSRSVTRTITDLIREPEDVTVIAASNMGMDAWLELEGRRILPLTNFYDPLAQTHGDGANFSGQTPFVTSRAIRVILVACDPYTDPRFQDSVALIKSRFVQAGVWTRQPAPSGSSVQLWTADLVPAAPAR